MLLLIAFLPPKVNNLGFDRSFEQMIKKIVIQMIYDEVLIIIITINVCFSYFLSYRVVYIIKKD